MSLKNRIKTAQKEISTKKTIKAVVEIVNTWYRSDGTEDKILFKDTFGEKHLLLVNECVIENIPGNTPSHIVAEIIEEFGNLRSPEYRVIADKGGEALTREEFELYVIGDTNYLTPKEKTFKSKYDSISEERFFPDEGTAIMSYISLTSGDDKLLIRETVDELLTL